MNSVVNFRDIGGFPTQQGTVVKTGHFFRSGELVNIAQADQQKLVEDYQINESMILEVQRKRKNDQMIQFKEPTIYI